MKKHQKLEIMNDMIKDLHLNYGINCHKEFATFSDLLQETPLNHQAINFFLRNLSNKNIHQEEEELVLIEDTENNVFKTSTRKRQLSPKEKINFEENEFEINMNTPERASPKRATVGTPSPTRSRHSQKSLVRDDSFTSINSIDTVRQIKSKRNLPNNFTKMNYNVAFLETDQDIFVPDSMIAVDEMSLINCVKDLVKNLDQNDEENFRVRKPLAKSLMNINRRNKRNYALRKMDLGITGGYRGRGSRGNMNKFR